MSASITVPASVASAASIEAKVRGTTVEQHLLATLAERFGHDSGNDTPIHHAEESPLLKLVVIAKTGSTDSSIYHDYRPGDPI
jgi:hypothetical protein